MDEIQGISEDRIKFLEENEINEDNSSFIFEGYYSSTLEILHAVVLKVGYKVLNHVYLSYYLRDVLNKDKLYRIFDDCRYKRNSLIYYGEEMEFEMAEVAIEKTKNLISELEAIYNE